MKKIRKLLKFSILPIMLLSSNALSFSSCSQQNNPKINIIGPDVIYSDDRPQYKARVSSWSGDSTIIWSISNSDIATIDKFTGQLMPLSHGNVTIYATLNADHSVISNFEIAILALPTKVNILGETKVVINCSEQYVAQVLPESADQHVTWTVENYLGEATITQDGILNPIKLGAIGVCATSTNPEIEEGYLLVRIVDIPYEVNIEDFPRDNQMVVGDKAYDCTATVKDEEAKDTIIWSSSNPEVASIDAKTGKLLPKSVGQATIRAASSVAPNVYDEEKITIIGRSPLIVDFTTDPWSTVIYYANQGIDVLTDAYKNTKSYRDNNNSFVGLLRPINILGAEYDVRVVGVNVDRISGTAKNAALTFEFAQVLSTYARSPMAMKWNGTNSPYWYNDLQEPITTADIRLLVNDKILHLINEGLGYEDEETPIKTILKISRLRTNKTDSYFTESENKIFLLSLAEMFSKTTLTGFNVCDIFDDITRTIYQEGSQYEWYKKNLPEQFDIHTELPAAIQKRTTDGTPCTYWTRSQGRVENVAIITHTTPCLSYKTSNEALLSIVPCFCI